MISFFRQFINKYFDPKLNIHKQSFNLLACTGILAGIIMGTYGIIVGVPILNIVLSYSASVYAFFMIQIASIKNIYTFCLYLTVILVFIVVFPVFFFTAGGYHSGMPSFYIFALVFTAMMIEGKKRFIFTTAEMILYVLTCIIAYIYPESVGYFDTERDFVLDVVMAMSVSGTLLVAVFMLYLKIYNTKQKALSEAYKQLEIKNNELKKYIIHKGSLTLDLTNGKALLNGRDVNLTIKEFAILLALVQNQGKEMSGDEIYKKVWGIPPNNDTKTVRNHISRLRSKLDLDNTDEFMITSDYGKGYSFIYEENYD